MAGARETARNEKFEKAEAQRNAEANQVTTDPAELERKQETLRIREEQRERNAQVTKSGVITNKARTPGGENKGAVDAEDYEGAWNKDELQEEVESRGLTVEGSGANGAVLKSDLIAALQKDDAKK